MVRFKGIILIVIITFYTGIISHAGEAILIQSTTSTKNAGFFEYILPIIEKEMALRLTLSLWELGPLLRMLKNVMVIY